MRKFAIPINARELYPIKDPAKEQIRTDSWFDFIGEEHIFDSRPTDKTVIRCSKVIVKPNITQRKLLNKWFFLYRYVYNQCVLWIRKNKLESFYSLRKKVKDNLNNETKQLITSSSVPINTIDNAINDVVKAYKSAIALCKKTKKRFNIRYKKENANQTIVLEAGAFSKKKNMFSRKVGVINTSQSIIGIKNNCRLTMKNGKFILFVPKMTTVNKYEREIECCSLDPGLRTFQTIYCADGSNYSIGNNVSDKLKPLFEKLDNGKTSKYKKRIRDKISNIVDDLHWKTANILCKISDKILIGNMSTIGVLQGNLTSTTKRILQAVSHYTFRQRLKSKCEEYGVIFQEVDESYTSKTCGNCGEINQSLGSSKKFNCKCGFSIDRDVNGARNIMIKNT